MDSADSKKILIITYYWPPSGGAGVQRWLKFAKYLPEYGWEPIIFTPENPDFDLLDESLMSDVNEQIEVLKFPIWEPYKIFKRLSGKKEIKQGQILESGKKSIFSRIAIWIRGNLFVPDPRVFWVKPSAEYLQSILKTNEIKHVITTGPPHSVHLIGQRLKLKNPSLTWVADFRDPWTEWSILKAMKISGLVWKKHKRLEREVLKMADVTLATGPLAADEFKRLGARKTYAITNGYDEVDNSSIRESQSKERFVISHVGMLNRERNPRALWETLNELCKEESFQSKVELRLTGILSQEVLEELKRYKNLQEILKVQESVSHKEVFQEYQKANLLLLLQSDSEHAVSQLPGKLFEYLSVKRPILALGNEKSDVNQILKDTRAGQLYSYANEEGIREFLTLAFADWENDVNRWEFLNIERFSRKKLTADLAELLNSL